MKGKEIRHATKVKRRKDTKVNGGRGAKRQFMGEA